MVIPKFSARRGWPLSYDNDPDGALKVALHQQRQGLETKVQGPEPRPSSPHPNWPQKVLFENQVSENLVLLPLKEVATVRFRKEAEFSQMER